MMTYRKVRLLLLLGLVAFATPAHGQALFVLPDTTPNYASYRHLEECLVVGYRVSDEIWRRGQTIWWDTVVVSLKKTLDAQREFINGSLQTGRPDSAIHAAKSCLSQFNADTATFKTAPVALKIVEVLFMAERWDDAQRFANRMLDSMRVRSITEYKNTLQRVLDLYVDVRPVRFTDAKQYYTQLLASITGDSLYRTIDAKYAFSRAAQAVGDTMLRNELFWDAIHANDETPVAERTQTPRAITRLRWLAGLVARFTREEGFDSLSVSTLAYNLYRANTVDRRVYGGAPVTSQAPAVQPVKVPMFYGQYQYTARTGSSPGPSNRGLALYTKLDSLERGALPVKDRINYLRMIPGFCSYEEETRMERNKWAECAEMYAGIRRIGEWYPELEITVLSYSYGTVGQLGPLQPADEADTLAKLFLGHHRLPAHLVVEKTPFFHVADPDGRRIDVPTPMMEEIGSGWEELGRIGWFTDKEGYRVQIGWPGNENFDRFYKILMNRARK